MWKLGKAVRDLVPRGLLRHERVAERARSRVVVHPGESAQILDFKTDVFSSSAPTEEELEAKAAVYRPQLELYRRVLAKMTGLDETKVTCALLFTKPRKVWAVGL